MRQLIDYFLLLCGTLTALIFTLSVFAQASGETRNRWSDSDGGWVISGTGSQNSASCGCPAEPLPCSNSESDNWPSRCLKENVNREKGRPVICYLNRAKNVREVQEYPIFKVPNGYPNGLGGYSAGQELPFPGWPAEKPTSNAKRISKWGTTLRKKFIKRYEEDGGKPPGDVIQDYVDDKGMSWGHAWQIHHLVERKHNGTDTWGNMIPVYSVSGINNHQKYTTWWQRAKVDSEFVRKPKTWPKIKSCQYMLWPQSANQRENIGNWTSSH